jgi:glycosyltransferase involved in cell wall biosynthesis
VRALVPFTPAAAQDGDEWAAGETQIELTGFLVPYFRPDPLVAAPAHYRRDERRQIRERLPILLEQERPDVILIGRAIYVLDVADIAAAYAVPCVLRSAGASTRGIQHGLFPRRFARELLAHYRKMSLIISPAVHLTETLLELGCKPVKTIPNAVDLYTFSPRPPNPALRERLGIRHDDIVVAHASNMKMVKRPLDIVEAAALTVPLNPRLVYVILGDGPLRVAMAEACHKRRLANNFRFAGWVAYRDVPDYINLADMVVMPSEAEGLARVYLETLACARVLIASAIPATRELIVDGESGLLFRKGDINDMAAKILGAGADRALCAKIGSNGYERAKMHGIDDAVAAYVATLEGHAHIARSSPTR